jgi:molybdopterin-guanine dinucleotide biosynthesis protein A
MSERTVTALVLAGGRSSRFGRDKLAEPVDGRRLLEHAVAAVHELASGILVVAAPGADPALPEGTTLVRDPVAFQGPLAGVLAGLRAATDPVVLVVGGDMPSLVGPVLESMLAALDAAGVEAVVLDHEGRPRPLPLVLRRDPALATAQRLYVGGERRLRALPEALATHVIAEATWRALDPDARTVRDIDTRGDLMDR